VRRMRHFHRIEATEERKCLRNVAIERSSPSPPPPPPSSRQCKAPEKYEPSEEIRSRCQEDGRRWKPSAIAPSPSPPQQPRPMTSLQLWLNQPKIDQRVQELERQISRIALGEAGQVNPELHEFLITLVTGRRALRTASKCTMFSCGSSSSRESLSGTRRTCVALRGALRSSCRTTGRTLCDGQCSAATRWKGPSRCGSLSTANPHAAALVPRVRRVPHAL
jgi:hypothetical protein